MRYILTSKNDFSLLHTFYANGFQGDFMDKERDQCDEDFFQMMLNSCKKSDAYDKSTCIYWASGYFDAVSSYGSAHFDGRRDCCNQTVKLQVDGKFIAILIIHSDCWDIYLFTKQGHNE